MHFEFLLNASETDNDNPRQYEFIFSAPLGIVNESYQISTQGHIPVDFYTNSEMNTHKIFKINHVRVDPRVPSSQALQLLKEYFLSLGSLWDDSKEKTLHFMLTPNGRLQLLP